MFIFIHDGLAPVRQFFRNLFPTHPNPADYPPGSLWFCPGEQALFFIKDIRKGRSHPGVVRMSQSCGRTRISAGSHHSMNLEGLVAVSDIPASLQTRSMVRVIASLRHDLYTMHQDPEETACTSF